MEIHKTDPLWKLHFPQELARQADDEALYQMAQCIKERAAQRDDELLKAFHPLGTSRDQPRNGDVPK